MARPYDYTTIVDPYNSGLIRETSPLLEGTDVSALPTGTDVGTEDLATGDEVLDRVIQSRNYRPIVSGFKLDGRKGTVEAAGIDVGVNGVNVRQATVTAISVSFWRVGTNKLPDGTLQTLYSSDGTSPDGTLTGALGDLCWVSGEGLYVNIDGMTGWSALADMSDVFRPVEMVCYGFDEDVEVADGVFYLRIHPELAGWKVTNPWTKVVTAGVTGTLQVQIYSVTQSANLTTSAITTASGSTDSAVATVNPAYEEMSSGEWLRIDVKAVQTTAPVGLVVGFTLVAP